MAIPKCDIDMTEAVDATGFSRWCDESEVEELKEKVYETFYQTKVGQEFKENYLADSLARVTEVYTQRYGKPGELGKQWAGVVLCGRLEEVVGDLMKLKDRGLVSAWLPEEPPPPPPVKAPPSAEQEHRALVLEVRRQMGDPAVSAATIAESRRSSAKYARAFADAQNPAFGVQQAVVPEASETVKKFARQYSEQLLREGVQSLKIRAGFHHVARARYTSEEFENLVRLASEAKLI